MRNLKRALSLALASVMLMGMMVVGASAASFPDVDASKHNIEAIEVLHAVGVMNGDAGTGNLRPDDKVSRNEMAVIMARLILGNYAADSYVGTHPFTDVPSWADRYVAACYNSGIINGTSATTYSGTSNVTAVQAAAMMLRALGYEDLSLNAAKWDVPVAGKANEINLFEGLNGSGTAQLTRNDIAKLSLNTLKADVVNTERTGFDMEIPGVGTINSAVTYKRVERTSEGTANYAGSSTTADGYGYQQLCEKLYGSDLKMRTNESDAFGRPSTVWEYDKEDVISTADDADKVYVGEVKAKDIYVDLKLRGTISAANVSVYQDSETATHTESVGRNGAAGDNAFGTNGQTVYVYYDKGNSAAQDTLTISVVSTYLGIVTDDSYTQDNKDGIRVEVLGQGLKFFETTGYSEDDLVLVTVSDGEIDEIIGVPETVEGEVTELGYDKTNAKNGDLTIDGTKYAQSIRFSAGDGDVVDGEAASSLDIEKTYTLYLDQNGCYLAAVEVEDGAIDDELVYVHNIEAAQTVNPKNNRVENMVLATVAYMDGTHKEVVLSKYDNGSSNDINNSNASSVASTLDTLEGTFARLKYDEDDNEYEMVMSVTSDYASPVKIASTYDFDLEAGDRYANFGGGNVYLNDSTVYVFVNPKSATEIDDVEVVTGGVNFKEDNKAGAYLTQKNSTTAKYVVIVAEYTAAAKDIVYIKADEGSRNITDGRIWKGYFQDSTGLVDVKVDGRADKTSRFYSYKEKSNGLLELTPVSDTYTSDPAAAGQLAEYPITSMENNKGYLLTIGGETLDLAEANVIDLTDGGDDNEYSNSAVNTASALYSAVNAKSGGAARYTVKVSVYANKDGEITNLVIHSILEGSGTVSVPSGSNSTTIGTELSKPGVDEVKVEAPSGAISVPAGKTVTATGNVSGSFTNGDAQSTTKLEDATITGSVSLPSTGKVELDNVTVSGSNTLTATSVKLTGNVTVGGSATLVINGAVDDESTGEIVGAEGATLQIGAGATGVPALGDFYDASGNKITSNAALVGKTFIWKDAWGAARALPASGSAGWYETEDEGGETVEAKAPVVTNNAGSAAVPGFTAGTKAAGTPVTGATADMSGANVADVSSIKAITNLDVGGVTVDLSGISVNDGDATTDVIAAIKGAIDTAVNAANTSKASGSSNYNKIENVVVTANNSSGFSVAFDSTPQTYSATKTPEVKASTTIKFTGMTGANVMGATVTVDGKVYEFVAAAADKTGTNIAVEITGANTAAELATKLAAAITTEKGSNVSTATAATDTVTVTATGTAKLTASATAKATA